MHDSAAYRRTVPRAARVGSWTASDGWRLRRFDWIAERPRGRLLFQTGRGDSFEKYLETLAYMHGQGWSVTAFDWRGQGGSGRLSTNTRVGHVDDFGIFDSDLAAFWRDWRAEAPGPRAILGHSMGGYLVLHALALGTIDPDAAILVAPMLGLASPLGARWGGRIARFMTRRGDPARGAWRSNEKPASIASRQRLLTHDTARYLDERWWHDARPELRLGPPSWQWLAQAFGGTAALETDTRLADVTTPVLMIVADADKLVDPRAAVRIAASLPDVELLRFGRESAHEILREADPVRDRALAAIDSFLTARVSG